MLLNITLPEVTTEEELNFQVKQLVATLRGALSAYKELGINVPSISASYKKAKSEEAAFTQRLLDIHYKRMPTCNVPKQRSILKRLYEQGRTEQELIDAYNEKVSSFPGTDWGTVLYHLNRQPAKEEEFVAKPLNDDLVQEIAERLKNDNV